MSRVATWLSQHLVLQTPDGALRPPGAGSYRRWIEPDQSELTIVARGDAFDVYFGRNEITTFSISPRVALGLARYFIWWWIKDTWCGMKLGLWWWSLRRILRKA